jgi:hypothetical protein
LVCLGLGFVLFLQVFNLLFEEPDLSCALQLDCIKLVPRLDILHDLLLNLSVLGLQLMKAVFNSSQLIGFFPGSIGHCLRNKISG